MKRNIIMNKSSLNILVLSTLLLTLLASCSKTDSTPVTQTAGTSGLIKTTSSVGPSGPNNNLVYYGTTDPDSEIGCFGDFYLDISKGFLYGPKAGYGWGKGLAMDGATAAENQVYSGTEIPAPTFGKTGDYYLNTMTSMLYGPRKTMNWGTPINLLHPGK